MIAIVTGASAGLGAQFARQIAEHFPEIDTLWLIARRVGKLEDRLLILLDLDKLLSSEDFEML